MWPEEPEDLKPWNKQEMEDSVKEGEKLQSRMMDPTNVNDERRTAMKEQAKALLEGKMKWRPMAEKQSGRLLNR